MLTILFLRLKLVFDNLPTHNTYRAFNAASIVFIVSASLNYGVLMFVMIMRALPFSLIVMLTAFWVFLMLIYSQVLAFSFVQRLFKVSSLVEERDTTLIAVMTRYLGTFLLHVGCPF